MSGKVNGKKPPISIFNTPHRPWTLKLPTSKGGSHVSKQKHQKRTSVWMKLSK